MALNHIKSRNYVPLGSVKSQQDEIGNRHGAAESSCRVYSLCSVYRVALEDIKDFGEEIAAWLRTAMVMSFTWRERSNWRSVDVSPLT